MRPMFSLAAIALAAATLTAQAPVVRWLPQASGVTARLRGVSAVSSTVGWASGAAGTVLRTSDAGTTWQRLTVPGAEALDFRDIDATDARTAHVLSIGPGAASRIYQTSDAGATWTERFVNTDPQAFFDAMTAAIRIFGNMPKPNQTSSKGARATFGTACVMITNGPTKRSNSRE